MSKQVTGRVGWIVVNGDGNILAHTFTRFRESVELERNCNQRNTPGGPFRIAAVVIPCRKSVRLKRKP